VADVRAESEAMQGPPVAIRDVRGGAIALVLTAGTAVIAAAAQGGYFPNAWGWATLAFS